MGEGWKGDLLSVVPIRSSFPMDRDRLGLVRLLISSSFHSWKPSLTELSLLSASHCHRYHYNKINNKTKPFQKKHRVGTHKNFLCFRHDNLQFPVNFTDETLSDETSPDGSGRVNPSVSHPADIIRNCFIR